MTRSEELDARREPSLDGNAFDIGTDLPLDAARLDATGVDAGFDAAELDTSGLDASLDIDSVFLSPDVAVSLDASFAPDAHVALLTSEERLARSCYCIKCQVGDIASMQRANCTHVGWGFFPWAITLNSAYFTTWVEPFACNANARGMTVEFGIPEILGSESPAMTCHPALDLEVDPTKRATGPTSSSCGAKPQDVVRAFAEGAEFADLWRSRCTSPSLCGGWLIDATYQALLHRAPEPAARAYWSGELGAGRVTRAAFVSAVAASAELSDRMTRVGL